MLWFCLHFVELPLEVFTRATPALKTHPLIVVQEHRVAHCNPLAREQGIAPGMTTATACALATSLQALERDRDKEHHALQQLARWAYRLSPAISVKPPADLLLEVGASLKLFHGLQAVTRQIDTELCAQGFSYRIGLAHTPKAAWLIARSQAGATPAWFDDKRQILLQPLLDQALGAVPLRLLDLPAKVLARLHKPGFRTLGDILGLPRPALGKRFGRDFLLYLEQLLGTVPDPQITIEPEPDFHRQLDFLDPIHRSETLLLPMERLLQELSDFLISRQLDCSGFNWRLLPQDQEPIDLAITLARPRHQLQTFLALTRTRLENLKLTAPVAGLTLDCNDLSHCEQTSEMLFEEWRGQQQQAFDMLLDKLGARLQAGQIYRLARADEHLPEMAWQRLRVSATARASAAAAARNRPGWLLPNPLAIGHRGNTLYWQGSLELILGPERIESHWWQQQVKRDYFIARHQHGGVYWVYRDTLQQRWFLHGVFA